MGWDDALVDTAEAFADTFGEDVVVIPRTGPERPIKAVVNRRPLERYGPNNEVLTPKLEITVRNDATHGISTASDDLSGSTRVRVAVRKGDTAEALAVYLPPPGSNRAHDAGMISLDLK